MSSLVFVKYCPRCDAENPRLQSLCLGCHADLTMVRAEPRRSATDAATAPAARDGGSRCILELVADPCVRIEVHPGQVVGRTDAADIALAERVTEWQFISSRHAQFTRRGEQWYVKHIGGTNYNIVDGERYTDDDEVALYDTSVLVISKTVFRVRIEGTDDANTPGGLE